MGPTAAAGQPEPPRRRAGAAQGFPPGGSKNPAGADEPRPSSLGDGHLEGGRPGASAAASGHRRPRPPVDRGGSPEEPAGESRGPAVAVREPLPRPLRDRFRPGLSPRAPEGPPRAGDPRSRP